MERDEYVDQIFRSFMGGRHDSTRTKEKWLDGENGWRTLLRRIGEIARSINAIDDIAVARREWGIRLTVYEWVKDCLDAVPLLNRAAIQAGHTDELFREFMTNLATLATL